MREGTLGQWTSLPEATQPDRAGAWIRTPLSGCLQGLCTSPHTGLPLLTHPYLCDGTFCSMLVYTRRKKIPEPSRWDYSFREVRVRAYMHTYVCMCVCMCVCTCVHVCVYLCVHLQHFLCLFPVYHFQLYPNSTAKGAVSWIWLTVAR